MSDEVIDNLDYEEIVKQAKRCFTSPAGKIVLAYLKETYVEASCLSATTNETMYHLGQKELVQLLISMIKEKEVKLPTVITEEDDK
jgi:hypothetical protein